jgi:hypothetical protein
MAGRASTDSLGRAGSGRLGGVSTAMVLLSPPLPLTADLLAAGDRYLSALGSAVGAADPEGRVEPRSRLLCAGLGLLAEAAYRALGGHGSVNAVGRAAAMLALLTKIDDQVIDSLAFHGGASTDRGALRERTRAFLAPTLASVRSASPASDEPRCTLAAALGAALRELGGSAERRDHLLATIAAGWEIQVEAVAVLTLDPAAATRAQVAAVTQAISGAWLLMIAMVGTLPDDATRAFSAAEEEQFFAWGWAIQRADALADLEKDLADGHRASWAGLLLWERAGAAYLDAAARGDLAAVYALVRAHGVDRDSLPDAAEAEALGRALGDLGEVPALLAWIHAYLVGRYEAHPLSTAAPAPAGAARFFPPVTTAPNPQARATCSAP